MSELELLESTWDFSALHAELDVICPLEDTMACCGVLGVVTGAGTVAFEC